MKQLFSRYAVEEHGAVYVIVLGMSVICFGFIGLMFDAGRLYIEHTRLQHFADRISIAAAVELDGEDDAITRARNVINSEALAEKAMYATGGGESFELSKIQFLTGMPAPNASSEEIEQLVAQNGADARFVQIEVAPRSLTWSLLALNSAGLANVQITTSSLASQTLPEYGNVDFIFAIDNSQSMLMGATQDDQDNLEDLQGCAFACHVSYENSSGNRVIEHPMYINGQPVTRYEHGVANGVRFRIDAATDALENAIIAGNERSTETGATVNFEVYNFALNLSPEPVIEGDVIDIARDNGIGTQTAPGLNNPDQGTATAPGQQKKLQLEPFNPGESTEFNNSNRYTTDPEFAFEELKRTVDQKILEGSNANLVVVLVTDGVASFFRGTRRYRRIFNAEDCNELKSENVQVGVIYTKYIPVSNINIVSGDLDDVPENLQECASPGMYFEATFESEIKAAFEALVKPTTLGQRARLVR
ncbi:MAG: Tad domain-containing protein [Rhodobacteraceae bacterium]|nr:Tad domain-containing protein [Paracoccaceae bacterium]